MQDNAAPAGTHSPSRGDPAMVLGGYARDCVARPPARTARHSPAPAPAPAQARPGPAARPAR